MEYDILEDLLDGVRSGEFGVDGRFPSENEIAMRYLVPRITARRTLSLLEGLGYLRSERGRGRYVRPPAKALELDLSGAVSFTDKMAQSGKTLRTLTRVAGPLRQPAGSGRRWPEGIRQDREYFIVRKLRIVDGSPAAIHVSWLDAADFPDASEGCKERGSLFSYFRSKGWNSFSSGPSLLHIALPGPEDREALGSPFLSPVFVVESSTLDGATGKTLQHSRVLYRSDRFVYRAVL